MSFWHKHLIFETGVIYTFNFWSCLMMPHDLLMELWSYNGLFQIKSVLHHRGGGNSKGFLSSFNEWNSRKSWKFWTTFPDILDTVLPNSKFLSQFSWFPNRFYKSCLDFKTLTQFCCLDFQVICNKHWHPLWGEGIFIWNSPVL